MAKSCWTVMERLFWMGKRRNNVKHHLTDGGLNLMLRGLAGSKIEFSRIALGNGPEQGKEATDLSNPLLSVDISKIERNTTYVTLSGAFRNTDVSDGFSAKEIGVFAADPDNENAEILYCLWYEENEVKADYVPAGTDRILETQIDVLVFVGEAENVSASLSSSLVYASAAELKAHMENQSNPHKITAAQIGLGNIENKTISEQTPIYDNAEKLSTIQSGEKIGSVFAKVKLAIETLMNHLTASNPHKITAALIGAAASTHYHNATQITAGTLSVYRGGTGCASLETLAQKLATYLNAPVFGTYTGDGTQAREIVLGFKPACVILANANGNTHDDINGYPGGIAFPDFAVSAKIGSATYDATWSNSYSVLMITDTGFKVNQYSSNKVRSNEGGMTYRYIAFRG